MEKEKFTVKVPGSTANLGPGFDSFGLALPLYLTIKVELADKDSIFLIGENLQSLANNQNNLIYKTIKHLFEVEGQPIPPLALTIKSDIPLSRGLGSSGAAIVGGLLAANKLLGEPKNNQQLFEIATALEGHPDNVGASLFGGFIIAVKKKNHIEIEKLPFFEDLKLILAIPNYTLATKQARNVIPQKVPIADASSNIAHAALLIAYLMNGKSEKLYLALKDRLHQPYRQKYVKGLEKILRFAESQQLAAALSGAGPTLILFVKNKDIDKINLELKSIAEEEKIKFSFKNVTYAENGAEIS